MTHKLGRFVEIMAPVFSRNAWRCVWYMIQVDNLFDSLCCYGPDSLFLLLYFKTVDNNEFSYA